MRYLRGIVDYGLRYVSNVDEQMYGYVDSDWAGSAKDRKTTSTGRFSLGSTMISWMRRKKTFVALNIVKEEYIAANLASCEAIWL